MKVANLIDKGHIEFENRPEPSIAMNEVLIAIKEVGICGSDIHFYEDGRIGKSTIKESLILGHESAGQVVEVAAGVTDIAPGDRVAIEPGVPCRRCQNCKKGQYHLCPDVKFMAAPPSDGAFAEYVAWPEDFVYKLPDSVTTREGALCEPLSVGIHACKRGEVSAGDTILVIGAGPIGLLTMEAARVNGATDIVISDVIPKKLELAAERGADRTVHAAEEDVELVVDAYTNGDGADVVIEASGAESAIDVAINSVRTGGNVVLVGMGDNPNIGIDTHEVIRNEKDVCGSFRYVNTYDRAINMLFEERVDVEGIVDFEYPFKNISDAFEHARRPDAIKGIVVLSR